MSENEMHSKFMLRSMSGAKRMSCLTTPGLIRHSRLGEKIPDGR